MNPVRVGDAEDRAPGPRICTGGLHAPDVDAVLDPLQQLLRTVSARGDERRAEPGSGADQYFDELEAGYRQHQDDDEKNQ